jgi:hypothetical protein
MERLCQSLADAAKVGTAKSGARRREENMCGKGGKEGKGGRRWALRRERGVPFERKIRAKGR